MLQRGKMVIIHMHSGFVHIVGLITGYMVLGKMMTDEQVFFFTFLEV